MQGDLASWLDAASGTAEEFVDRVWRLAVRRPPEPDARDRALAKLRDGTLSPAGPLRELGSTAEVEAAREAEGDEAALRELRRVLAKNGRLLVSVPTGEHDDQGWQLQRTPGEWVAVFERAGFLVYEDELYVHAADGWRSASLEET